MSKKLTREEIVRRLPLDCRLTPIRSTISRRTGHVAWEWLCSCGNSHVASSSSVLEGSCRSCGCLQRETTHALLSIHTVREAAKNNGFEFVASEYRGCKENHSYRCKENHMFLATHNKITQGRGCPFCSKRRLWDLGKTESEARIKAIKLFCLDKPFSLTSDTYVNNSGHLNFECSNGHSFSSSWMHIKRGQGCPDCNWRTQEPRCRSFLQIYTGKTFKKTKSLPWLVNSRGRKMELDGYSAELRLAFEYHGEQHYKFIPHFGKTMERFQQRQQDDQIKRELCASHGITLIEVPYFARDIEGYLKEELERLGITSENELNFSVSTCSSQLQECKQWALGKSGECLSEIYNNKNETLLWRCAEGHEWRANWGNIKLKNCWCPYCYKNSRITGNNENKIFLLEFGNSSKDKCRILPKDPLYNSFRSSYYSSKGGCFDPKFRESYDSKFPSTRKKIGEAKNK